MAFSGDWLRQQIRTLNGARRSKRSRLFLGSAYAIDMLESRVLMTALPVGNEFQVNTFTTKGQLSPSVATDADGDYVITWQSFDQDGPGAGVYAQRYNSAGAAVGSEFRVNTFTTGYQADPAVAMDADGDFVITWRSHDQNGNRTAVYAQRYNSSGIALGGEFLVKSYDTYTVTKPAVDMDADGDFVITWHSFGFDGSSSGVAARRYDATGAAVGSEFQVNTYTTSHQSDPAVAMDSDGDFVITWQSDGQDGDSVGIYAQRYNSAGATVGGEFRVNSTTLSHQTAPAIAMDSSGDFVIVWQSHGQDGNNSGIFAQRYDSVGVSVGGEFQVNTYTQSSQSYAAVAMDADGNFVVTWNSDYQDGSHSSIYAQRYDSAGIANGGEFRVNTYIWNRQSNPVVSMDVLGGFIVTWQSKNQDGSDDGVFAQRFQRENSIDLTGNVLSIAGTASSDNIIVSETSTTLSVTLNGVISAFTSSSVTEIRAFGVAGDDLITLSPTLRKSARIYGGEGNDTLNSSAGDDVLDGGIGNDTYRFNSNAALGADTVTDSAGIDEISFAGSRNNVSVSLGSKAPQIVNANSTLTLATSSSIENLQGGDGNDTLTGNSLANELSGGLGNDVLIGLGGDDNVDGGSGNDTYLFNTNSHLAADIISDEAGVDRLDFTGSILRVSINLSLTTLQTVNSNLQLTLTSGSSVEHVYGGTNNDAITGNSLKNYLVGNEGNDTLTGDTGDDTLDGGAGNDRFVFDPDGPLGSDTVVDSSGLDSLDFSLSTADVLVNLRSTGLQNVNSNLTLTLTSSTAIENASGGFGNDVLIGNNLANSLLGGPGNDTLTGGASDDRLEGGAGNDVYLFNTGSALGSDTVNDSAGVDGLSFNGSPNKVVVNLSVTATQTVNANLNLMLTSTSPIENLSGGLNSDTLTGNARPNILDGGSGNDSLFGLDGSDTLSGLDGNDQLNGGEGHDIYLFNTSTGLGSDSIADSGGIDSISFVGSTNNVVANLGSITSQVVNSKLTLKLTSAAVIENLYGGDGNDTLAGNALGNTLDGGGGNDTLAGVEGNDQLHGQAGDDMLDGSTGNDSYLFNTNSAMGADTISDSQGVDWLTFEDSSNDVSMNLGLTTSQRVNENLTLSLMSPVAVEKLSGGSGNDLLTGNSVGSVLYGGDGNDRLQGKEADDILYGEAGDDFLDGGLGNDSYAFNTNSTLGSDHVIDSGGVDTLTFAGSSLDVTVGLGSTNAQIVNTNLTLTLATNSSLENVYGGAGNDTLTGNPQANRFVGGSGNDVMVGGAGNDWYDFDVDLFSGSDTVDESGGGIDTLNFSATTNFPVRVDLSKSSLQSVSESGTSHLLQLNLLAGDTFENVFGGSRSDTLTGNALNNSLSGNSGDDLLAGGAGNDTYTFDTDTELGSDTVNDTGGGVDALDFRATSTQNITVDLNVTSVQVINSNLSLKLSSQYDLENVFGGALDDILIGNSKANTLDGDSGNDVISGRAGADVLVGGALRDILIGGLGADNLAGGAEDDLLLGARFLLEDDAAVMEAIRKEWISASSFEDRVAHLLGTLDGGLNDGFMLTSFTVKDDGSRDILNGNTSRDWFLLNRLSPIASSRDNSADPDLDSLFTEINTWL